MAKRTIIGNGAEATVYKEKNVAYKERPVKSYRHPHIDKKLRVHRTRHEAKILQLLAQKKIIAPRFMQSDEKACILTMEYVLGKQVKYVLTEKTMQKIGTAIGILLAQHHVHDIIHSDLTTSNILYDGTSVIFVDYGLGFISKRIEDRAIDLHLLEEALESYHPHIAQKAFSYVLKGYESQNKEAKHVFERLLVVKSRGKNKK